MKQIEILIIVILLVYSSFSCSPKYKRSDSEKNEEHGLMVEAFNIPFNVRIQLEKEALNGSPEAAFKLHNYYKFYLRNIKESMYWAQIAAENGHAKGMYNYGFHLFNYSNLLGLDSLNVVRAKRRAYFWFKRAEENGICASFWLHKVEENTK